jgi:hypothetical protein
MSGSPVKRRRREAEGARGKTRAKVTPVATRRRAVARAEAVGDKQAAGEFDVTPATVRSWRRRAKAEASSSGVVAVGGGQAVGGGEGDGPLGAMRGALEAARRVEAQAVAQTERHLREGNAGDARNAAAAGGIWSDKAVALGKALAVAEGEQEAEAARLSRDVLDLLARVLTATFAALDVPVPLPVMRLLAAQAAAGDALCVPEEVAVRECERVRVKVRAEHLDELVAGGWSPAAEQDEPGEENDAEAEVVEGVVVADAEPVEPEQEVEPLPDGVTRDERGDLWRSAFTDSDGVYHGSVPIVEPLAPRPPREGRVSPFSRRTRFDMPGM